MGYLDEKYGDLANSAFDDFVETFVITDDDGLPSITNICGACGLGGDPYRDGSYEYYISEKVIKNDNKGVAPFILAAVVLGR
jgi:unsaturated rhamnogalacturonyl hydrolase